MANLQNFAKKHSNIEYFLSDFTDFDIILLLCHFFEKMYNRSVELTDEQLSNLAWVETQIQEKMAHQKSMNEHIVPLAENFVAEVVSVVSNNPVIFEDGYKYTSNPSYTIGDGDLKFNIGVN